MDKPLESYELIFANLEPGYWEDHLHMHELVKILKSAFQDLLKDLSSKGIRLVNPEIMAFSVVGVCLSNLLHRLFLSGL